MKYKQNREKGTTLIELLIYIGLLAIFLSVLTSLLELLLKFLYQLNQQVG